MALAGRLVKGIGGLKAGNATKKHDFAQAREEQAAALDQETLQRAQARQQIGAQLAGQYANGFEGGSGSALNYLRESQINAALDAMEIRRQGAAKADALRYAGNQAQSEGRWGLASDILSSGSQAASMASDWAQARRGTVPASSPPPSSGAP